MLQIVRILILVVIALALVMFAVANRDLVTVQMVPAGLDTIGQVRVTIPLFVLMIALAGGGFTLGYFWGGCASGNIAVLPSKARARPPGSSARSIRCARTAVSRKTTSSRFSESDLMRVKICGLTSVEAVTSACTAGAAYVGFVFYPPSPRNLDTATARELVLAATPGIVKVGLFVDADDATLDGVLETVPLDMLQLQGSESPERAAELRARHGLPVMKAIGVREAADLDAVAAYAPHVDQILIDAKPPEGATLPGGNGRSFDWSLLQGRRWPLPWMLAGGLTPENAARAANLTGARQLDVSSGVESAPGVKDPNLVRAFIADATRAG